MTSPRSHSFARAELRSKPSLLLLWPAEALFFIPLRISSYLLNKCEIVNPLFPKRIYSFRHVSGREVRIWCGVCGRPFSPYKV